MSKYERFLRVVRKYSPLAKLPKPIRFVGYHATMIVLGVTLTPIVLPVLFVCLIALKVRNAYREFS